MSLETKITKVVAGANIVVGAAALGAGGAMVCDSLPSDTPKTQGASSTVTTVTNPDDLNKMRTAGLGQLAIGTAFVGFGYAARERAKKKEEEEKEEKNHR